MGGLSMVVDLIDGGDFGLCWAYKRESGSKWEGSREECGGNNKKCKRINILLNKCLE